MKWDLETFIVCCSVYLLCQQNEKWTDGLMYRSASHSFDAQQRPIDVYNISPYAYPPCPPESCVITPWWMKLCRLSDASPLWARSSWHRSVCSIENESRQAYLHGVKKLSWFIISSKELFTEELCWSWCEDSCYLWKLNVPNAQLPVKGSVHTDSHDGSQHTNKETCTWGVQRWGKKYLLYKMQVSFIKGKTIQT